MTDGMLKTIVVLLGVLTTLGIYSVLYKENKIFRFFEHLYLGLAGGYAIAANWNDVLKTNWWEPMVNDGKWWLVLLLPAGSLFYFIYSKKNGWMARLIFGLFIGLAAGQQFQGCAGDYWPKIQTAATKTLWVDPAKINQEYPVAAYATVLNNWLFMAILTAVMVYFFFSFEQKSTGAINKVSKFGRYAMMIAFGAMFGNTIMARMALLIGRIYFLIHAPEAMSSSGP
ncbi:hypothetical protein [Armatimonas sp.]|uniref:hypothetical protein n=1 Tax=Armatimonas sp. TaxID=1872638 RepID=UPI00286B1E74|nr:hypothetical protein [Armatimonas sp.]